jgi:hypothetical protein
MTDSLNREMEDQLEVEERYYLEDKPVKVVQIDLFQDRKEDTK